MSLVDGKAAPCGVTDEAIAAARYPEERQAQLDGICKLHSNGVRFVASGDFGDRRRTGDARALDHRLSDAAATDHRDNRPWCHARGLSAAPSPVVTPQPMSASSSSTRSVCTGTIEASFTTIASASEPQPHTAVAVRPSGSS